jgi:MFS family permease
MAAADAPGTVGTVPGMFAPSSLTGWLSDRIGAQRVAVAAGVLYLVTGVWGGVAPEPDVWAVTGFLLILGVAWNMAIVSGSALLPAGLTAAVRPSAEAAGEVAMGLAAAGVATGLGITGAIAGWAPTMAIGGLIGSLVLAAVLLQSRSGAIRRTRAGLARHVPSEGDR